MYKPKESFLKLNNNYTYMGGLTNTNTLKRYSQPIIPTNIPPPKKVHMEIPMNKEILTINDHKKILNEIQENLTIFKNKKQNNTFTDNYMEIEQQKTVFNTNDQSIGYLDGVTKKI